MSEQGKRSRDEMPPVPRDYNEARYSELMPLKSSSINVLKSPILYMVVVTAVLSIWSFDYYAEVLEKGSIQAFSNLVLAAIGYMLLIVLLLVFVYAKTGRPFWTFLPAFLFVALLLVTPLGQPYFIVFREILPGKTEWALNNTDFIKAFIGMFFAAGLMEELMKVTLVAFGAYIAINAATWRNRLSPKVFDIFAVRGPLDGLVMGLFGGAGFIFIETGLEYVPNQLKQVAQATGNDAAGLASALMLLLPRTIGGMVGHMAWAGITGYFIGLAVVRPVNALKFVGLAWAGTATLHAIWNTSGFFPIFSYLSAGVSGVFLVACLLKARQLEMAMGRTVDTYGSILVRPNAPAPAGPAPMPAPQAPVSKAAPQPVAAAAATAASQMRLVFDAATIPVVFGRALELAKVGNGGGDIRAEVTQHPTRPDVLGLKNLGSTTWNAKLRDGTEQRVAPERNIRLADGVRIDFGAGLIGEVMS